MTSSNPNYLPKALPPNNITLGLWLQYMKFGVDTNIQSIAIVHQQNEQCPFMYCFCVFVTTGKDLNLTV